MLIHEIRQQKALQQLRKQNCPAAKKCIRKIEKIPFHLSISVICFWNINFLMVLRYMQLYLFSENYMCWMNSSMWNEYIYLLLFYYTINRHKAEFKSVNRRRKLS